MQQLLESSFWVSATEHRRTSFGLKGWDPRPKTQSGTASGPTLKFAADQTGIDRLGQGRAARLFQRARLFGEEGSTCHENKQRSHLFTQLLLRLKVEVGARDLRHHHVAQDQRVAIV